MAKQFDEIDDHLRAFVARQRMFFVGTAPLSGDGHVNVSPKGPIGTLRILGPHRVAYLDYSGSGAETVAHLRENGRIVVMLCAFEGPPRIVRFHGTGEVVFVGDPRYEALLEECAFDELTEVREAQRSIVLVDVARISDSCGYGVPLMAYEGQRPHFDLSKKKRLRTEGSEALVARQASRNAQSIDGLPAVVPPEEAAAREAAAAAD
ncbi:MAG TPA: pyridoxamine 5'-phosphate oxidase family protein [Solirubrobacteraceae bacterium]|nr:pyridoxamine 5'-phosphate oxidase family protein [Solirubrobacteraceae bacterium]